MMKTGLSLLFWLSTFAAMFILFISIGWLLGLFGIALIPVIVLHIVSGSRALNRLPLRNPWLLATSLSFLFFSLLRPDMDDVNPYTGFSVLMNFLGARGSRYVEATDFYFWAAILLIIITITIDILILRQSKQPPPVPVNNDFV